MSEPTPEQLEHAAEVLGVSADDLSIVDREAAARGAERHEQYHQGKAEEAARAHASDLASSMQQVVAAGDLTPAEAAAMLLGANEPVAHGLFVGAWRDSEALDRAVEDVDDLRWADAETYATYLELERAEQQERLETELQQRAKELEEARLDEFGRQFRDYLGTAPGAHVDAKRLSQQLGKKIIEGEGLPETFDDRQRMIEKTERELAVLDAERESIEEQIRAEWRALKKESRGDGLNTRAEADRAEEHYKRARFEELAASRVIEESALELPAPAAEISAAEAQRFSDRERKSVSFHEQVYAISERGTVPGSSDRGESITEERKAYREALQRSEDAAAFGEFAAVRSGYGDSAVEPETKTGAIDEFGGAFPGYE